MEEQTQKVYFHIWYLKLSQMFELHAILQSPELPTVQYKLPLLQNRALQQCLQPRLEGSINICKSF